MQISSLPKYLWSYIFEYLDRPSLGVVGRLNKGFNEIVFKDEKCRHYIWKWRIQRGFIPDPIRMLKDTERMSSIFKFWREENQFFLEHPKDWCEALQKNSFGRWFTEEELNVVKKYRGYINAKISNEKLTFQLCEKHPFLIRFAIFTKKQQLKEFLTSYILKNDIERLESILNALEPTQNQIMEGIIGCLFETPMLWTLFYQSSKIAECLSILIEKLEVSNQKEILQSMLLTCKKFFKSSSCRPRLPIEEIFKNIRFTIEPELFMEIYKQARMGPKKLIRFIENSNRYFADSQVQSNTLKALISICIEKIEEMDREDILKLLKLAAPLKENLHFFLEKAHADPEFYFKLVFVLGRLNSKL